jgi:predicted RNase H-like nuclease (RuvC/YqgF family)
MTPAAEVINALGGLGGVAAIVTSTATLIQARRINAQVSPNHGSSLADAVNRTDAKTAEAVAAVSRLEDALSSHSSAIERIESALTTNGETVRRIETEQTKTAADVMVARHQIEGLARELKGLGHEIGDIRSTRDREHGDYDARIRSLEGRA